VLVFSLYWHYDVYFRQLPASMRTVGASGVPLFLAGERLVQYPPGWDLYVTSNMNFPYEIYCGSTDRMGAMNIFFPRWDLPLKQVPEKGAFLLLPEDLASIFGEWVDHYYPEGKKGEIRDPFGEVQYRSWEITPNQVRKALLRRPPSDGIWMGWHDAKDRRLGRWLIPSLAPGAQKWFDFRPGSPAFPYDKVDHFKVQGWIRCSKGASLALETNGDVDWTLGDETLHFKGPEFHRIERKSTEEGWVPIQVLYRMKGGQLFLDLYRLDPEGWEPVPPADWKP
jgi:hypothetical protein